MARAEAESRRFMASLLVMGGMNFVPEKIGRSSISQYQNSRGNIAMGFGCVKPDRPRLRPVTVGCRVTGLGNGVRDPAKILDEGEEYGSRNGERPIEQGADFWE